MAGGFRSVCRILGLSAQGVAPTSRGPRIASAQRSVAVIRGAEERGEPRISGSGSARPEIEEAKEA